MKINALMTKLPDIQTCLVDHTLAHAAQLMSDHDIGALPVVDDAGLIVGMITDRDALMAAYESGRPLSEIVVRDAMSADVVSCHEDDRDEDVAKLMANAQVRRIPVVDDTRKLVGMVSLTDLAQAMRGGRDVTAHEVADTLAEVSKPRAQPRAGT